MTAIGGAPTEITLDGRSMQCMADADVGRMLGGAVNEVRATGGGGAVLIKRVNPWSLEDLPVVIDETQGDLQYLEELASRDDFFPITITYAGETTDFGVGQIDGEVKHATGSATANLTLKGPGRLTP